MYRFSPRDVLTVVLALALAVAGAVWLLQRAIQPLCGSILIAEFPAPSKPLKASLYVSDCGATTDVSTQVSILDSAERTLPVPGNALVVDTDHGRAPRGSRGGPEVRIAWAADTVLVITYDRRARVFSSATHVRGVSIKYGTLD